MNETIYYLIKYYYVFRGGFVMEKLLLDLEMEIINGQKNAKKTKELYQLLSSCNAYNILLLKAKQEYESKKMNIERYYSDSDCYKNQIADLFSLFKSDEYLCCKFISGTNHKDMLFLIDQDTLLRIHSFDIINSSISGLSNINYSILKINSCLFKSYKKGLYSGNTFYGDSHCEYKDSFGLLCDMKLITPEYVLDSQFKLYNNRDIREVLKVQSLEEIQGKINEAKNIKTKKLILTDKNV